MLEPYIVNTNATYIKGTAMTQQSYTERQRFLLRIKSATIVKDFND